MKQFLFAIFLVCCSCSKQEVIVRVVLENQRIHLDAIKSLDTSERALLSWYLYTFGNACEDNSTKFKCLILKELNIDDECNPEHLNNLLHWFSKDMLASYKLKTCPNIASNSAIQNEFIKIVLIKHGDTISIEYKVEGMNNSQEKSWNFDKIDKYVVEGKTLVRISNK